MEERVYPCVSDREFDSCKMGQIVRDAIVSWFAIFDFLFPMSIVLKQKTQMERK